MSPAERRAHDAINTALTATGMGPNERAVIVARVSPVVNALMADAAREAVAAQAVEVAA